MFWAQLCPSSGAHDDSVSYHIGCLQQQLENQAAYVVTYAIVVSSWWWA